MTKRNLPPSATRRRNMQAIKSANTKPEMIVRRMVHGLGYRYRLHAQHLPGKPDLVFEPRKKVVFVHGCFWHAHDDPLCPLMHRPKTNKHYWTPKLLRNRRRDAENLKQLSSLGWEILIVWECQIRDQNLTVRLRDFLG